MEKREIVRLFLQKGYFLEKEALEILSKDEKKVEEVLEKLKNVKDVVITPEVLFSIPNELERVDVLKEFKPRQRCQISVEDFHKFFVERYIQLKEILERKPELTNLISINKITRQMREFSIIASILEKGENFVIAEDLTGSIKIYFNGNDRIDLGEIVGIKCELAGERIFAKELIRPDIPLKKRIPITRKNLYCLFLSELSMDDERFNREFYERFLDWIEKESDKRWYIFFLGRISSKEEDVVSLLEKLPNNSFKIFIGGTKRLKLGSNTLAVNSPAILKLANIIFLLVNNLPSSIESTGPEIALEFLKRRYIQIAPMEGFFIDPVPDIFVVGGLEKEGELNYKGTTILSTGKFISKPIFWIVDLAIRKIIKIDLSKV